MTTPWGAGGLEQLPLTLGHPGDQLTPGLLSVPLDPAGMTQSPHHSQFTKDRLQTPPLQHHHCSKT